MKNMLHVAAKIIFSLILLLPVVGSTGALGEPTRDLYNTDEAFAFINMLTEIMYISYIMAFVHVLALIALWTKREVLAALLALPVTVNVVGFHAFLDGGLFTAGAVLANVLLLINLYLLYRNKDQLAVLLQKQN